MAFLHTRCISGPINSRRLGKSLGINILPSTHKICNFNCVYCECGWNTPLIEDISDLPSCKEIEQALDERLSSFSKQGVIINSITFSGNGEPTLHPYFEDIMNVVYSLRNRYMPHTPISVISNSTMIGNVNVVQALSLADNRILKFDAGSWQEFATINGLRVADIGSGINKVAGVGGIAGLDDIADVNNVVVKNALTEHELSLAYNTLVENLHNFPHTFIMQTLFFRGSYKGKDIDNSKGINFDNWLEKVLYIQPSGLMIYGLDRETPDKDLQKLSRNELEDIAGLVRATGLANVNTFY